MTIYKCISSPIKCVEYPLVLSSCGSRVKRVARPEGRKGDTLPRWSPVLCAYSPVSSAARDGELRDAV